MYEIINSLDSTRYLVFTFSAVKHSLAYDEEEIYQETDLTLELISKNAPANLQPRKLSYGISLILMILAIIIFIAVGYLLILPDRVKRRIFGLGDNPKSS